MALVFSVAPALVFLRSRRPLMAHVVFSLHFYAFLLLLLCIATSIPAVSVLFGGVGLESATLDYTISISLIVVRILNVATLTVGVAAVLLGYRFFLLLITLFTA